MGDNEDFDHSARNKRRRIISPPETPKAIESNEDHENKFLQILTEAAVCHDDEIAEKNSIIKEMIDENEKLKARLKDAKKRIQDIALLESKVKEKEKTIEKFQIIADSKETIIKEKEEALSLNKKLQINFKEMTKKFEGSEKEREKILMDNKNLQAENFNLKKDLDYLKKEKQTVLVTIRGLYNHLTPNNNQLSNQTTQPPPQSQPQSIQQIRPLQNPQQQLHHQPPQNQTPGITGNSFQPNQIRSEEIPLRTQNQNSQTSGQTSKPRV